MHSFERFNAAMASVNGPGPYMVLIAVVSGIMDISSFKISLHRDPPTGRGRFTTETNLAISLQ